MAHATQHQTPATHPHDAHKAHAQRHSGASTKTRPLHAPRRSYRAPNFRHHPSIPNRAQNPRDSCQSRYASENTRAIFQKGVGHRTQTAGSDRAKTKPHSPSKNAAQKFQGHIRGEGNGGEVTEGGLFTHPPGAARGPRESRPLAAMLPSPWVPLTPTGTHASHHGPAPRATARPPCQPCQPMHHASHRPRHQPGDGVPCPALPAPDRKAFSPARHPTDCASVGHRADSAAMSGAWLVRLCQRDDTTPDQGSQIGMVAQQMQIWPRSPRRNVARITVPEWPDRPRHG
jgi:hypothetical protein